MLLASLAVVAYAVVVDISGLEFVGGCLGVLVAGLVWRYLAFAQWLTRDGPAERECSLRGQTAWRCRYMLRPLFEEKRTYCRRGRTAGTDPERTSSEVAPPRFCP